MRGRLIVVTGIAVVLTGLVVIEASEADHPADRNAAVPAGVAPGGMTGATLTTRIPFDASSILSRPLFNASRRPVATTIGQGPAQVPRLSAVLINGNQRSAIFDGDRSGKPEVAAEGSRIGPYLVQTIRAGEVTVMGPDGVRSLHPRFANSSPSADVPVAQVQTSILERLLSSTKAGVGVPGLTTAKPN